MPEDVFPVLRTIAVVCALASAVSIAGSAAPMQPVAQEADGVATPPQSHAMVAGIGSPRQPKATVAGLGSPMQPHAAVAGRGSPGQPQAAESRFALALVNDARGQAIVDIGDDDFVVQEGGATREVLSVRVADYPVVLVVDNGASAGSDFTSIKAAVTRLVERLGPRPLAVVTTAGTPKLVAALDDERESLAQAIDAIEAPASVDSRPLAAAALAAQTLTATGTLFSTIVMITASPIEGGGAATEASVAPIIDSRAVLHIVANDRLVANGGALLRGLAQQTRGEYTAIFASPSYTPALERIAVRLTSEMLIEYIVPVGSHAIDPKIGVRIPGARVRGLGVAPR